MIVASSICMVNSYPEQPDEQSMQEANKMFLAFVRGEYEN